MVHLKGDAIMSDPFETLKSASVLAQAIVDTVREPLLVLDSNLHVVAASRSFLVTFRVASKDVLGRSIYDLVEGRFNIPELQSLLQKIVPDHSTMDGFEIEAEFPGVGHRALILNAREVFYEGEDPRTLLLAFEDVTERRVIEGEKEALLKRTEELLHQKEVLLEEMQHRVANSLTIIASILMMKARSVTSEETRLHLQDAHRRVLSVATVQQHIQAAGRGDQIQIRPYLTRLCESLSNSMIGDGSAIALKVVADEGTAVSSHAVSLGLIVTELVINALKHAFPTTRPNSQVLIGYESSGSNWRVVVADNGVGKLTSKDNPTKNGLGTSLVNALAHQLGAQVELISNANGVRVSITHSTFNSRLPQAA